MIIEIYLSLILILLILSHFILDKNSGYDFSKN